MKKYPPPQLFILLFVFLFSSFKIFEQARTLAGVVRDSANQPLVSATVTVKGKKISTTTAADGSFTLSIPTGSVDLEIAYVGYNPVTVPVNENQTEVAVTMQ